VAYGAICHQRNDDFRQAEQLAAVVQQFIDGQVFGRTRLMG
jgi:hypothetical protein